MFKATLAQPGEPYNPETYDGASYVGFLQPFELRWVNSSGVKYNEVYLSYDSAKVADLDILARLLNGNPDTVYAHCSSTLGYYGTRFYWRIVEYNSTGKTIGPIWQFKTKGRSDFDIYSLRDDFTNGTGLWSMTGNQNCKWKPDIATSYTLPHPAYGNIISVRNSQNGTMDSSTAYLKEITLPDSVWGLYDVYVEFDSDLKLDNPSDSAFLDYSIDHGLTWITSWSKKGQSDRNSFVSQALLTRNGFTEKNNIQVRIGVNLADSTSYWAIDNFNVGLRTGALSYSGLNNLHTSITSQNKVKLHFEIQNGVPFLYVYRKNGFPKSPGDYTIVDTIRSYDYLLPNTNDTDETVQDSSIYTYRVGGLNMHNLPPTTNITNEATVYINKITAVEPETKQIISEFELLQNYPNPFNPSTTISYTIPKAGNVSLKVYDMLGREVTTLINDYRIAGKYEVNFLVSNLASGLYIYKIQSGNFISTKKMMFLK